MKVWYEQLKDMNAEQIRRGVLCFTRGLGEIYPNTNPIHYIRKYGLAVEIDQPTAGEAWQMVLKEVSRIGFYGTPQIKNSYVQNAVERMGWRDICLSDNVEALRAHFIKIYETHVKREQDLAIFGPIETVEKTEAA